MTDQRDCLHPAMRVEPGTLVCSRCGLTVDRKPIPELIADMRDMLHKPIKPTPKLKGQASED